MQTPAGWGCVDTVDMSKLTQGGRAKVAGGQITQFVSGGSKRSGWALTDGQRGNLAQVWKRFRNGGCNCHFRSLLLRPDGCFLSSSAMTDVNDDLRTTGIMWTATLNGGGLVSFALLARKLRLWKWSKHSRRRTFCRDVHMINVPHTFRPCLLLLYAKLPPAPLKKKARNKTHGFGRWRIQEQKNWALSHKHWWDIF